MSATPSAEYMTPAGYRTWLAVHRCSSAVLGLLALLHIGLTWLAGLNLAYTGVEPCRRPTTKALRAANHLMAVFGVEAVLAVPEVQAGVVLAALAGQAVAASRTLPGPA